MRVFIGVPVSEEIKEKIKPLIESLKATGADLNLVSLKNLHFTVKFLGEVSSANEVEEIKDKLSKIHFKKFDLKLETVGVFPSLERMNVVWIGIKSGSNELVGLMKKVNGELYYIRKNEHEEIPHLTIARVKTGKNKEKLQEFIKSAEHGKFGSMTVDKLILYKSDLTPEGPVYSELSVFNLR